MNANDEELQSCLESYYSETGLAHPWGGLISCSSGSHHTTRNRKYSDSGLLHFICKLAEDMQARHSSPLSVNLEGGIDVFKPFII